MDLARVIAYLLDTLLFAAAAWAACHWRRHPILFRLMGFQVWLLSSLAWSVFLLCWGVTGHSGSDTLAAITGYVRVLGPASLLACVWDTLRHGDA